MVVIGYQYLGYSVAMKLTFSKSTLLVLFLFLVFLCILLYASLPQKKAATLSVSFLDVGQGDAILIQSPSGMEVLIDGGKDTSVLGELASHMSLFDRNIDIVLATHPDAL